MYDKYVIFMFTILCCKNVINISLFLKETNNNQNHVSINCCYILCFLGSTKISDIFLFQVRNSIMLSFKFHIAKFEIMIRYIFLIRKKNFLRCMNLKSNILIMLFNNKLYIQVDL